ncbi:hypothetical protein PIB30_055044 [Stylosanthes scabra]|uniref:Uncharacterized protein n=1 Tax=Stylosanthes scabra TaxID=79078 RepID=A0ABU6VJX3_9FABA|nr:hypothetical protein [Stylosanthes scabra]
MTVRSCHQASECLADTPPHLFPEEGNRALDLGRQGGTLRGSYRNIGAVAGEPGVYVPFTADPQPNNRQAIPREDGHTASDSNSDNGRRGRANQATSARRASPQRVASHIHIPRRDGEQRNTHDLMGIVTGQLCRLDRLENDLARRREI